MLPHLTHTDLIAGVAILALIAALLADVIAWQGRRDGARALLTAHTHPRRQDRPPPRDPGDRRLDDRGPPPDQPERRRHRAPEDDRARRRDADDPRWHVDDRTMTERTAALIREDRRNAELDQPPVRLSNGRTVQPPEWWAAHDEPDTDELHPPTRDMRRLDPPERPR